MSQVAGDSEDQGDNVSQRILYNTEFFTNTPNTQAKDSGKLLVQVVDYESASLPHLENRSVKLD